LRDQHGSVLGPLGTLFGGPVKTLVGLLIATAVVGVIAASVIGRQPSGHTYSQPLVQKMSRVRVVWAEYYASTLQLPASNAEGNEIYGRAPMFGAQTDMGAITHFNVLPGGIFEVLLRSLDEHKQPLRAVLIPRISNDGRIDGFVCVSHNWQRVGGLYQGCTFDANARAAEAAHVAQLAEFNRPKPYQRRASAEWEAAQAAHRAERAADEARAQSERFSEAQLEEAARQARKAEEALYEARNRQVEQREQSESPR
jgi:hypothetical protein